MLLGWQAKEPFVPTAICFAKRGANFTRRRGVERISWKQTARKIANLQGYLRGEAMARKSGKKRKYSKSSGSDVKREMHRYKRGTAKSGRGGKGGKVKSRKQAIAIGLSKARKKGKKVPKKRS
jgi:hypothetical protein